MEHTVRVSRYRASNGSVLPDAIYFDGKKYVISAVLNTFTAQGITTYTVIVKGCITHLYADDFSKRWYVKEKKRHANDMAKSA